jgi:hypothetical protein
VRSNTLRTTWPSLVTHTQLCSLAARNCEPASRASVSPLHSLGRPSPSLPASRSSVHSAVRQYIHFLACNNNSLPELHKPPSKCYFLRSVFCEQATLLRQSCRTRCLKLKADYTAETRGLCCLSRVETLSF